MITPRRTRLVRVADLHALRHALAALTLDGALDRVRSRLVLAPTRGAARQLRRTIEGRALAAAGLVAARGHAVAFPDFATRDELYDRLHARLPRPPRRLTPFEREVLVQAASREAVDAGAAPPFQLRPGLVAEIVRFYDQLRRQGQGIVRFEELLVDSLQRDAEFDRGAERMLRQTRFLAATCRAYERRAAATGACDEHALRARLIVDAADDPVRDVVVTVGDWIADPNGLYRADFDMLTRMPGVETITVVATEALLASGFHQRIHEWLPGIEEVGGRDVGVEPSRTRPRLDVPTGAGEHPWFVSRDREEELMTIARRVKADRRESCARDSSEVPPLERIGIVFRRPLPYLYLAREVFGGAAIPYQVFDALPLAAEPVLAAWDLVLEFAASAFTRDTMVALLRSPHFAFTHGGKKVPRAAVAALDVALSEARYLGELDRLAALAERWNQAAAGRDVESRALRARAMPALLAGLSAARELSPLLSRAPASAQIRCLRSFLAAHAARPAADDPFELRRRRASAAALNILDSLGAAHATLDDTQCDIRDLAPTLRRWIEEETFVTETGDSGLQLVDAQAARYGDFDTLALVGLIEGEWPERPRRNIFYPSALLAELGWPSEQDRRGAADAAFLDLLASAARRVSVSTVTLDEDALVEPSSLLDEIARSRLTTLECQPVPEGRIFIEEALSLQPPPIDALQDEARNWAELRLSRSAASLPAFHGSTGPRAARPWSVSALETYLGCPFKFFAQHVLRLEEEPDDEEVMDPRKQGQFMHEVFEAFFKAWQDRGYQAITPANIGTARSVFAAVVEDRILSLPDAEATLERTRLLGSPVATGLGEAVLRMEAERPVAVVARLLEHRLEGEFEFDGPAGRRRIALRGKADRLDLLADATFRLIDYKLGWARNRGQALQLPIYSLCAEQRLNGHLGRHWTLGEAAYIAFGGPRRVVPLFSSSADRAKAMSEAQGRLLSTIDAIDAGEFPPRPTDVHQCITCSYASVCRKDYVGDV